MKKGIALAIFVLLGGLAAGLVWLFFTTSGARLVLSSLGWVAPFEIRADMTAGTLAAGLDFRSVEVRPRGLPLIIRIGSLQWSWHPARLLDATIAVDRLAATDVVISDMRPRTKEWPPLKWPETPRLLAGWQGWIREFSAKRVRYVRLGEEEFSTDSLSARLFWHHGILSLSGLALNHRSFSARGTLEAGFVVPILKADMILKPVEAFGNVHNVTIRAELTGTRQSRLLAGPFFVGLSDNRVRRLSVDGRIGMTERSLALESFRLASAGVTGSVTGSGSIEFGGERPRMRLDARLADVRRPDDAVALSGEVHGEGNIDDYRGTFRLAGKGTAPDHKTWQVAVAEGLISGGSDHASISIGQGRWLGGKVSGSVETRWNGGLHLVSTLHGKGFDPAYLSPGWNGAINLDAHLKLDNDSDSGLTGSLNASFPGSTLRGRPLFGDLKASFRSDSFRLEKLNLRGKGFNITASEAPAERLVFDADVTDLSGLIPGSSGKLTSKGWLQRRAGVWVGSVSGSGDAVSFEQARVRKAQFSARVEGVGQRTIQADMSAQGVNYGALRADRAELTLRGSEGSHLVEAVFYSGKSNVRLALQGALKERTWEGAITRASGSDPLGEWRIGAPSRLAISSGHLLFGPLQMRGPGKEVFSAQGDLFFGPLHGSFSGQWVSLNLARLRPFLAAGSIEGTTSGRVSVKWSGDAGARLVEGEVTGSGRYSEKTVKVALNGTGHARWDERGLSSAWEIALDRGGKVSGTLNANGPPAFELPHQASVSAAWESLDVAILDPWLPPALSIKGSLSGRVEGSILPGKAVSLTGRTEMSQGVAGWKARKGVLTTTIQTATARFSWVGPAIRGDLSCALAGYGKVDGRFSLPLPARLPPAMVSDGPLMVYLKGQVREQGLISAAMPGVLQEAQGLLDIDMRGEGTWAKPVLSGGVTLKDAGAYVPAAGIRLEKVTGQASLSGDGLRGRLRAESGGGWLEVAGDLRLQDGVPFSYQGTLEGSNFRALNLPDLRAYVTPRLTFRGDRKMLSARGEIVVPTMSIYSRRSETVVRPSSDVRIVDAPVKERSRLPLALDIQVRVVMGEKVRVEAGGLDGRLAGSVDLNVTDVDRVAARGRIRIEDGRYKAYGINLNVTRGNVTFAGPVERPVLDILAARRSGDVSAGVQVSGTIAKPVVNLYSNRPMSDSDKLGYLVLGHPVSQGDPGQSSLFSGTAGIFEGGATPSATSEAGARLGLAGTGGAYTGQDDTASSTIGVGRYLTPSFYVGVGRSTLTNETQITLRYDLSRKWEVESRAGGVTGMNLFYKIEFD